MDDAYPTLANEPEKNRQFLEQVRPILSNRQPANMLLRGVSQRPRWPQLPAIFGIRSAAIAGHPIYRGVSRPVAMEVLATGDGLDEKLDTLDAHGNSSLPSRSRANMNKTRT